MQHDNPDLVVINKRKLSMLLTQAIQNAESDEIELAITQLARSINDLMRGDDGD